MKIQVYLYKQEKCSNNVITVMSSLDYYYYIFIFIFFTTIFSQDF